MFERLDTVYSVDGGVSALALKDVNGDGRDDAIQTHLLTKEISVRLSQAGGLLGPAIYTEFTSPPVSLRTGDFNGDQRADVIIVHSAQWAPGLTILTGNGDGTFGAPPSSLRTVGSSPSSWPIWMRTESRTGSPGFTIAGW